MVDLDLRKLSAPIEALRPGLDGAYKRLDKKWDEIAQCLKGLPIPCEVAYDYAQDEFAPEDALCLEWKKWNGKKRICIVSYQHNQGRSPYSDYDITTTPYEEWSGQQRIDMLKHVPGLFAAAAKQTTEFIKKTESLEEQS